MPLSGIPRLRGLVRQGEELSPVVPGKPDGLKPHPSNPGFGKRPPWAGGPGGNTRGKSGGGGGGGGGGGVAGAWDIATASFVQSFSVATEETSITGMNFSDDGVYMYVIGSQEDEIITYTLSTPWDISTATLTRVYYVGGRDTIPTGVVLGDNGNKAYFVGIGLDRVYQYNLQTPWEISSGAAIFQNSFSVAGQDTLPQGVAFKSDGTAMFIAGHSSDTVIEYALSTPWAINSASLTQTLDISAEDTFPSDVTFKPDGTKMFLLGGDNDSVFEYALSTPWDISTATFVKSYSFAFRDTGPGAVVFKPDGTAMYMIGNANDSVFQYELGGEETSSGDSPGTHRYWRLLIQSGGNGSFYGLAEVQLRTTAGGADVTSSAGAIASGERSGFEKELAFDDDAGTIWSVAQSAGQWIGNDLGDGNDVEIVEVTVTARNDSFANQTPQDFDLEHSDDGVAWTKAASFTGVAAYSQGETKVFTTVYA